MDCKHAIPRGGRIQHALHFGCLLSVLCSAFIKSARKCHRLHSDIKQDTDTSSFKTKEVDSKEKTVPKNKADCKITPCAIDILFNVLQLKQKVQHDAVDYEMEDLDNEEHKQHHRYIYEMFRSYHCDKTPANFSCIVFDIKYETTIKEL